MKPTLDIPNLLLIGLYKSNRGYAAYIKLRSNGYEDVEVLKAMGSDGWYVLADSLAEIAILEADAVVILTNDQATVDALNRPFKAPKPTQTRKMFNIDRSYTDVPYGGDSKHWAVLQMLTQYCAKDGFKVTLATVEILGKTKELCENYWSRHDHPSAAHVRAFRGPALVSPGVPGSASEAARWFEPLPVLAW